MSKEVYNQDKSANIRKELEKKQIIDSAIVFVMFSIIFCGVGFVGWDKYDLIFLLVVLFLITMFLFVLSKTIVKKALDDTVLFSCNQTIDNLSKIQNQKNTQKENNINYDIKLSTIKEILANLQECSFEMKELTNQTQEKTSQSLNFTNAEYNAVKSNIEKMFSIRHKIQTIAELILELSDFVQSISSTIGLVEDIAEQTNLLALNAAVEAARAGEHGKGFAVVASEIRKLADESKQATTKIISLINDIQQTANSTVLATEEGTKEIESGLELAHVISEHIEQLINVMNEVSSNVQKILTSSNKINEDTKQSDDYIKEISKIVEENRKIADENTTIFENIEASSNKLKNSML